MRIKLPAKVKTILDVLQSRGYEAYAVGGCVRDSVMGREPHDWDITTSALPGEVKRCFPRTIDTGIKHGTVTVMVGREGFEVTTYRIDGKYSDGRHPDSVVFTPSLKEDLQRRDFTINAMAYNEKDGLVDIFGGMDDLQRRVVRCVGDPDQRFDEDALRIMRAVRFSAQLGFRIDPATRDAVRSHAEELRLVSAERIREEFVKLLISRHPEKYMELYELGLTAVFLPEFDECMRTPQNTPFHIWNVGEHIVRSVCEVPPVLRLRLTMALHDIGKPACRRTDSRGRDHFKGHAAVGAEMANEILRRLHFDNETRKTVVNLIRWHDLRAKPTPASVRKAMYLVGPENFDDLMAIEWADNMAKSDFIRYRALDQLAGVRAIARRIESSGDCLAIKDLAINGNDVRALGAEGKEIGDVLQGCMMEVLRDPEMNDREKLMDCAHRILVEKRQKNP